MGLIYSRIVQDEYVSDLHNTTFHVNGDATQTESVLSTFIRQDDGTSLELAQLVDLEHQVARTSWTPSTICKEQLYLHTDYST